MESSEISPSDSEAKRAWARLIEQVYEVDPLVCPQCAGAMRIIACIEQPAVIEKILTHLGLWTTQAHSLNSGVFCQISQTSVDPSSAPASTNPQGGRGPPDGASRERPGAARPPRGPPGLFPATYWIQRIDCA